MNLTVAKKDNWIGSLSALLYGDVEILETWETDEKVAVLWSRSSEYLETYQRDRLSSGLLPTYTGPAVMETLAEDFGLFIPCVEQPDDPMFSVVGTATYDANTDTLEV